MLRVTDCGSQVRVTKDKVIEAKYSGLVATIELLTLLNGRHLRNGYEGI
jgi:hypothetical protein